MNKKMRKIIKREKVREKKVDKIEWVQRKL